MGFQRRDEGDGDERAIERYRYMLQTAPPEDIERAHQEAFERLTPDQRRSVLQELSQHVPASELRGDDPASLARAATRAEMRQPGVLERTWQGPGLGGMFLSTMAGAFIGSAIAQQFFADDAAASEADSGTEGDASSGGDSAELGGDGGDGAGDFGGGDFGGGDFGGGDFGGF
jgi:hypothetical protein